MAPQVGLGLEQAPELGNRARRAPFTARRDGDAGDQGEGFGNTARRV
jgi:hypothetical protein